MGKYRSNIVKKEKTTVEHPHSIWRGIGCMLMLIIPTVSFALATLLIDYGLDSKWPIPRELLGKLTLPPFIMNSEGLRFVFSPLTQVQHFSAVAITTALIMFLTGGLISLIYAWVYRFTGPARYGPTDVPPSGSKPKKYVR